MSLVDDDVRERKLAEHRLFNQTDLVGSDANLKIRVEELLADDLCTLFFCAAEDDDVEIRDPSRELTSPVLNSRFRDDNKVGAGVALEMFQVSEEGDGLQCLTDCCGLIRINDGKVKTLNTYGPSRQPECRSGRSDAGRSSSSNPELGTLAFDLLGHL